MNIDRDRVAIAARALEQLEQNHNVFMEQLSKFPAEKFNIGSLVVADGEIAGTCLGFELKVIRRNIITRDGLPSTIEYSFFVTHNGDDCKVVNIYLEPVHALFADTSMDRINMICHLEDDRLVKEILYMVGEKLLDSLVFKP